MADTSMITVNGAQRHDPFVELGSTGLKHYGGRIQEEFLRAWQSSQKVKTIQEMQTDAVIAASFLTYEMLIRQVDWDFEAASDDSTAQEAADFARQVWFEDMSHAWTDTLAEILTMLPWGFAPMEITYKRRQGDNRNPSRRSRYTDGKIGIRKLAIRSQETVDHWMIDEEGGIKGLRQWDPWAEGNKQANIPIEKMLLFRTSVHKGNPEGRSLMRSCFVPWFHKKHIAQIQAIGIERDAAGLPIVRIPKVIMEDSAYSSIYNDYKKLAVNLRQDEQAGVVLPSDRDDNGNLYYDVSLLSAAGNKQHDTDKTIQQKNLEILLSLMTDVLVIGHEKVGSFALASDKTSLLGTALGGAMDLITGVINRHAMPRLWRLNGLPSETMPIMVHGDIESVDLDSVGNFILRLSQAGFQVENLENEIRRRTGFPIAEAE